MIRSGNQVPHIAGQPFIVHLRQTGRLSCSGCSIKSRRRGGVVKIPGYYYIVMVVLESFSWGIPRGTDDFRLGDVPGFQLVMRMALLQSLVHFVSDGTQVVYNGLLFGVDLFPTTCNMEPGLNDVGKTSDARGLAAGFVVVRRAPAVFGLLDVFLVIFLLFEDDSFPTTPLFISLNFLGAILLFCRPC